MFALNSLNSVAQMFVITVKGFEPAVVLETRMLPQCQQDTCERQYVKIDPNSCFAEFTEFPFNLGRTTLWC